jgi:hypothetical protein
MPFFKMLLDSGQDTMDELCRRFAGFYHHAKILETPVRGDSSAQIEEKTRNGILCTPSVNSPRKQRMSFTQRSITYVKSFLRAFTREKRYPTCFKFRFVSSPLLVIDAVPRTGEATGEPQ